VETQQAFVRRWMISNPTSILARYKLPGLTGCMGLAIAREKAPANALHFVVTPAAMGEERAGWRASGRAPTDYLDQGIV